MTKLASFLLVCLLSASGCADHEWPKQEFSQQAWARTPEFERYAFVNDLIDSKKLVGKKPDEVRALLGPPTSGDDEQLLLTYVVKEGDGFDGVVVIDVRTDDKTKLVSSVTVRTD